MSKIHDLLNSRFESLSDLGLSGSYNDLADKPALLSYSFGGGTNDFVATTASNWALAANVVFPGTIKMGTASKIEALISNAQGAGVSDFRIYNPQNATVIAQYIGVAGTAPQLVNLGSIANLPSTPSLLELQLRRTSGSGQSRLHALLMYRN